MRVSMPVRQIVVAARRIERNQVKRSHRHRLLPVVVAAPSDSTLVVAAPRGGRGRTTNQRDQNSPIESVHQVGEVEDGTPQTVSIV